MKRLKIVFGLLFCTVLCHAEDYNNLSFEKTDGSVVSVSADNLSMTFSGGKLLLDNGAAETQEIAVADLSRMFFSSSTSPLRKPLPVETPRNWCILYRESVWADTTT